MNNLDEVYNKIMKENPPKTINVKLGKIKQTIFKYCDTLLQVNNEKALHTGYIYELDSDNLVLGLEPNKITFKKAVVETYFNEQMKAIINE